MALNSSELELTASRQSQQANCKTGTSVLAPSVPKLFQHDIMTLAIQALGRLKGRYRRSGEDKVNGVSFEEKKVDWTEGVDSGRSLL